MTQEEVEAVIGGPPGDYSSVVPTRFGSAVDGSAMTTQMQADHTRKYFPLMHVELRLWAKHGRILLVAFEEGRVIGKSLTESADLEESARRFADSVATLAKAEKQWKGQYIVIFRTEISGRVIIRTMICNTEE